MTSEHLATLRARHSSIRYLSYRITPGDQTLDIEYQFRLEPDINFSTCLKIPSQTAVPDQRAERLIFLIGMVELLSYWKCACPRDIFIDAGALSASEKQWWDQLLRKGLGEFFFVNKLSPAIDIVFHGEEKTFTPELFVNQENPEGSLILVGGGKDSIVSLECMRLLNRNKLDRLAALCVNPIPASIQSIEIAGYQQVLFIKRSLDSRLRELNDADYFNGHTPYSALLAFTSSLVAYLNRYAEVLASNETSASEGNTFIKGFEVNHQYSKSFEFEDHFRSYLQTLEIPVNYYSLLRPMGELQICAIFSQLPKYHANFRSCNREQTQEAQKRLLHDSTTSSPDGKRPGWCGTCPKCVFVFLCLSCFLEPDAVDAIFGVSPMKHPEFLALVKELSGKGDHKPLECVGTYQEVQTAVAVLCEKLQSNQAHQRMRLELLQLIERDHEPLIESLSHWDKRNFLSAPRSQELHSLLTRAREGRLL